MPAAELPKPGQGSLDVGSAGQVRLAWRAFADWERLAEKADGTLRVVAGVGDEPDGDA